MPMSRLALRPWLGSSTSPPLIRRSNLSSGPMAARAEPAPTPVAARATVDAEYARNRRRDVASMAVSSEGFSDFGIGRLHPPPRRGQASAPYEEGAPCRPHRPRVGSSKSALVGGERIELPTSSV